MNKIYLIGNLTDNPEVAETSNGIKVARLNIAINSGYGDNKTVDYFKIVAWRGLAETCDKYLKKGNKVAVVGELHNCSYEDKNGNKRTVAEITANELEFLSQKETTERQKVDMIPVNDEDVPF